jgi:hypothetical protein
MSSEKNNIHQELITMIKRISLPVWAKQKNKYNN